MSLFSRAQQDALQILTGPEGFTTSITLTTPSGDEFSLIGFHSKHATSFDINGEKVRSKIGHVAIHVTSLVDAGYPFQNADNEVFMREHKVVVDNILGPKSYIVRENYPDDTLGVIVLILGEYKD